MLPELFSIDSMILRRPQGEMPTEMEASEIFPVKEPWEIWAAGRPKTIIYGSMGKRAVRVGYMRILFDVTVKADDLVKFDIDGQEYPMAIVQVTAASIIVHTGIAEMIGLELDPSDIDREMKGSVLFEVGRIKRLMDRVVPAHG